MNAHICPTGHRHAEVGTCYVIHKCRCAACREGNRVRALARRRAQLYGTYDDGLTDAAPVREHIHYLQASGLGWKRIAALSGVGNTAIESLVYGRKGGNGDPRKGEVIKRTPRDKAAKIMAVRADFSLLAGGALVPARGTRRRVQGLIVQGWSQSKLAVRLGMEVSNFGGLLKREQVTASTHRAVAELFDELWDQTPTLVSRHDKTAYTRTLRYAKQQRWLSPLAWDDIDNDPTPAVTETVGGVDEIAIQLAISGERVKLSGAERREAVTRLHALRFSDNAIAERLHIAARTSWRIRQELGLEAFEQSELLGRAA